MRGGFMNPLEAFQIRKLGFVGSQVQILVQLWLLGSF